MDPLTALTIGSTVAPVIGGILGNNAAAGDRAAARAAYEAAYRQFDGIQIPDEEKQKLALEQLQQQGLLTPEMEQAIAQGPTAYEDINTDPRLKQAQMSVLETLSKMSGEGLTATDRMELNAARRQVAGDARAQQESILQNMAARGAGGSGMELAARLSSQQAAADRSSQESDRLMAMAQQRMLQAVQQQGSLAGQVRQQDFGEQEAVARAKDQIANFNTQQQASVQARNIAARNAAQQQNLSERQRVADANVATKNAQQQYNKELSQKTFNNRMDLASAKSNALTGQGSMLTREADRTAKQYTGGANAITGGINDYLDREAGLPRKRT